MSTAPGAPNAPRFSLMFFSASEESLEPHKYRLVLSAARFADEHDFEAVWVPERHFASLGGLYPNPAVLQAALAVVTRRVHLRAGSVVLPLHDPLRVAEEWSVVDNLSGGRIGVSLAPGWNPSDFVLAPDRFAARHDELFRALPIVQALWRGEPSRRADGAGKLADVRILPRPVQAELPVWITAARSPETFARAGRCGAHLLSHLLDQDVDELAGKLQVYRQARAESGLDPATGRVTIMLHTFVGPDADAARESARAPYCAFLRSNVELLEGLARSRGEKVDFNAISPAEQDAFVNFLYDRFAGSRALIGSPETCLDLVRRLYTAGVDELACLLDFGPTYDAVLEHLPHLERLRAEARERATGEQWTRVGSAGAPVVPAAGPSREGESVAEVLARCPRAIEGPALVEACAGLGSRVDGGLTKAWLGAGEALARFHTQSPEAWPAVELEAGLAAALIAARGSAEAVPLVPLEFGEFERAAPGLVPSWGHARVRAAGVNGWVAEVQFLADDGQPCARLRGVRLASLPPSESASLPAPDAQGEYYALEWQPRPDTTPAVAAAEPPRAWLLLDDETGVGAVCAEGLTRRGHAVSRASRLEIFGSARATRLDEGVRERLRAAVSDAPRDAQGRLGVVHLWSLDVPGIGEADHTDGLEAGEAWGTASALIVFQTLAAGTPGARAFVTTRGAQPVNADDDPALAQSCVWGLGRTCAMEHPEVWGGLIDLDPADGAAGSGARLEALLAEAGGEDQVAVRGGVLHVPRLQRLPTPVPQAPALRADATYVVTGGLWGLGFEVARWLVERGARHLALPGRTALPPRETWDALPAEGDMARRVAAVRELERAGTRLYVEPVDVADEPALRAWLQALAQAGAPGVRGVVQAASVWRDAAGRSLIRTLAQLDLEALAQVFRPKVAGSLALHRVLAAQPLDFFVFFSSAASLTGSAGQGNYAAASTFMDALAHHRRRRGLVATSVNWGPVSGAGYGATEEGLKVHRYWESNGLQRLSPPELLDALGRVMSHGRPQWGVMRIDWRRLAEFFPALRRAPWASRLVSAAGAVAPSPFLQRLHATPALARRELLLRHVQQQVASIMRLSSPPDPRRRLFDMGLDSLMALELKTRLQTSLGLDVPVTAVFNHPTIEALTDLFLGDLLPVQGPDSEAAVPAASALDRLDAMSDAEAARLLAARLAGAEVAP